MVWFTFDRTGQENILQNLIPHPRDDLFSGIELPIGPPALFNVGVDTSAGVNASFPYQKDYSLDAGSITDLQATLTLFLFIEPMTLCTENPAMTQMAASL